MSAPPPVSGPVTVAPAARPRTRAAFSPLEALRKAAIPGAIVAVAALVTLALNWASELEHSELYFYDLRLKRWPNAEASDRIVPVPIDDESSDHISRYPWPRPVTARVAKGLAGEGARAVLVDITFNDTTTPEEDRAFVDAIEGAVPVVSAFSAMESAPPPEWMNKLTDDKKRSLAAIEKRVPVVIPGAEEAFPDASVARKIAPPLADFVERGPGVALATTWEDSDGVLRRVGLIRRDESPVRAPGAPRWIPSLTLAVVCRYYGVSLNSLRAERGQLVLPHAAATGESPRDIAIPVDSAARMLIHYSQPGVIASRFVSFWEMKSALESADPRARPKVKDRIALIYLSNTGTGDLHKTPLLKNTPGGLVNAEAINTILTARFVRVAPAWLTFLLGLVEAVLLVVFATRWTSYRLSSSVLSVLFVVIVGGFLVFKAATFVIPLAPLVALGVLGGGSVVFWRTFLEDRERIDLMFTLRALQNQALKERRGPEGRPTTLRGSTGASTEATDMLKRNVEYGRFIESLRDIESLQNTYIGKHYRLLNLIDEGGMGLVFRAYDEALDRTVAIKVLTRYSTKLLKRFQTEARAVGQLHHPNVVQVFAVASEGDIPYIVMEYVHGTSLSQRIRDDGPLPVIPALEVILQVARGLDAAHLRHIIHRDIKTSNVLLTPDGTAKVIDFGIAKFFKTTGADGEALTGDKEIVGTADYMSPEQGSGRPVDHRSDIYSLGITLFRVLTGKLPFRAEDTVAVLLKQIKDPIPDIRESRPDVPAEVIRILHKMVEKKPEDRYQSCREVVADIEDCLHVVRAAAAASMARPKV